MSIALASWFDKLRRARVASLGPLLSRDRRAHAHASPCKRIRTEPLQSQDFRDPSPALLELLDELEQGGIRGVVDQRHQVGTWR